MWARRSSRICPIDQASLDQGPAELGVLWAAGDRLGDPKVMDFKAPCHDAVRGRCLKPYQSALPAPGQNRGGLHHALRVIAERGVEQRRLPDGAVQKVSHATLRVSPNGHIDFHGPSGLLGEATLNAGVQRLAPDHQQLVDAEHGTRQHGRRARTPRVSPALRVPLGRCEGAEHLRTLFG